MKVVSDAGPLIALGKLGQLGLLLKLYGAIFIPREVYNEVVVNGLRLGASDAQAVDFLIQQGHIRVADVTLPSPLPPPGLSLLMPESWKSLFWPSNKRPTGCWRLS